MRSIVLCMCIVAAGCTALAQPSVAKRAMTPDDIYSIQSAGDPQISPDGKMVAYTVRAADRSQNKWHTEIWLTAADGTGTPRQFTSGNSSSAPRWSPDGRTLAFLSARRDLKTGAMGKVEVYALSMDGGEARRITNLKNGVSSFVWSPDGAQLAVISKIGPSDSLPKGEKPNDELDYQRAHIWVVNVGSGEAKQITFGDQRNDSCPESPEMKTTSIPKISSNNTIRIMSLRKSAGLLLYVASDDTHQAPSSPPI